jgi:hypothetical protein
MYKLAFTSQTPEAEAFTDWAAAGTMEGAITQPEAHKLYRCRFCGKTLPAWLPVAQAPDGEMLLGHLSQQHPIERAIPGTDAHHGEHWDGGGRGLRGH